jgi:uncharacterized protein YdhG (YjbR/CyaY superfamily)
MNNDPSNRPIKTVDDYLSSLPEDQRVALDRLRSLVKATAPEATEKISYGMPMFFYSGRLVAYAAFKDHLSFFIMSYKVMDMLKEELKPYLKAKATLHFSVDKPLPVSLVKKIVQAKIKENEEKAAKKK